MRRASISDPRKRLSEYLRAVRNGEEVIVTDRGVPVAKLTALHSIQKYEARLQGLIEAGLVRPPSGDLPIGFWDQPCPADPDGLSLSAILEKRERRW